MRLVDADKLRYKHSLNTINTTMPQSFPCITKEEINKAPTVEAIPKDQYEARLKADLEAILVELQLEIDKLPNHGLQSSDWKQGFTHGLADVQEKVIQKKINELKEKDNGK